MGAGKCGPWGGVVGGPDGKAGRVLATVGIAF